MTGLLTLFPCTKVTVHRSCDGLRFAQSFCANCFLIPRNLRDSGVNDTCALAAGKYTPSEGPVGIVTTICWGESDRHMLPMHKIGTDGMMPASTAETAVKKYVVRSSKESWCARVAYTARLRNQMILRP